MSDITDIATREGWLYLAVALSIQTRQVFGYELGEHMPDGLVEQALSNAWHRSSGARAVLFHADRGSQYASHDCRGTLTRLGFVPSMSGKANCWDTAVAEFFFAPLKNEEATGTHSSKADAHAGIASCIHGFYNPTRQTFCTWQRVAGQLRAGPGGRVTNHRASWRPSSGYKFK